jgi:hypothetical protein
MIEVISKNSSNVFAIINCPENIKKNWLSVGIGKTIRNVFYLTSEQFGYTSELLKRVNLTVIFKHKL